MTSENTEIELPIFDLSDDLWWVFYLRKPTGIETLYPLQEAFENLGLEKAEEYISEDYYRVLFYDKGEKVYLELGNSSDDISRYIFLGIKGDLFVPPHSEKAERYAELFLEYGKLCYQILQPIYAFAESPDVLVDEKDVDKYNLTHIFWAQLFSPDFVKSIGRNILRNAPGWRDEILPDGGLLYVLAASPYLNRYQGERQFWRQAQEYFNQNISHELIWPFNT